MGAARRWGAVVQGCALAACVVACDGKEWVDQVPPLGNPCDTDADCAEGLTCDGSDQPTAGMCTKECAVAPDCAAYGPKAKCLGIFRCVLDCESDDDCGAGEMCANTGYCTRATCATSNHCWRFACDVEAAQCLTSCEGPADCATGYSCAVGECYTL